jgi:hypothetical protein
VAEKVARELAPLREAVRLGAGCPAADAGMGRACLDASQTGSAALEEAVAGDPKLERERGD